MGHFFWFCMIYIISLLKSQKNTIFLYKQSILYYKYTSYTLDAVIDATIKYMIIIYWKKNQISYGP